MRIRKLIKTGLLLIIFAELIMFTFYRSNQLLTNESYIKVKNLKGDEDFKALVPYFVNLAETKGPLYAYDVLRKAKIKPGVDIHLLAHFIGDVLYKQKGVSGMEYCTEEFTNACSHTIVVGLFLERGKSALPEIVEVCNKVPGNKNAYGLCFHGLGHGVLAYTKYDLPQAINICSKIKPKTPRDNEFPQCVGGAIMEIAGGGFHDRVTWAKQHEKYLRTGDPLYPCNSNMIPEEAKEACYGYITPNLFKYANVDLDNIETSSLYNAFKFCENIENNLHRNVCYGGFGKEFVGLAIGRDVRDLSSMDGRIFNKIYEWCSAADQKIAKMNCIYFATGSIFWGGDNDARIAINFCKSIKDLGEASLCLDELIKRVHTFVDDPQYITDFCNNLSKDRQDRCLSF